MGEIRIWPLVLIIFIFSCNKNKNELPDKSPPPTGLLKLSFAFDSLQERLDNQGNISTVPVGFGAMSPDISNISIGGIELLADSTTDYGDGLYITLGEGAIAGNDTGFKCCWGVFDKSFTYTAQLSQTLVSNSYNWVRIYLIYQNYKIKVKINGVVYEESISAFLANKSFISHFAIQDSIFNNYSIKVNGEWFMEVDTPGYGRILHGNAITTSPNILYSSKPTPVNSCILTCRLESPLFIGNNDSLSILISLSTNKAFEWIEHSDPAFFEPFNGDTIVDVGIRGVKVIQ